VGRCLERVPTRKHDLVSRPRRWGATLRCVECIAVRRARRFSRRSQPRWCDRLASCQ
jgi:hypothetical protein